MLPGRFSLLLVCAASASVGLLFALGYGPLREGAPMSVNLRLPDPVRQVAAPPPPPPPSHPAPAPPIERAPVAVESFHWVATVKSHYVSKLTYGGDDGPTLIPNSTKHLAVGTPCRISARRSEKPGYCVVNVVCGAEEIDSGLATCELRSAHEPGRGERAELVAESRAGDCNGARIGEIGTKAGTALYVTDNSYAGPSIETERLRLTIVSAGYSDD